MGIQERKQREKARRRRSILDKARDLIATKSYSEITMEDIARELELSRATLYLYFNNKSEIFVTLLTEAMWQLGADYKKWLQNQSDASSVDKLLALARIFFVFYNKDHCYFDLMFSIREELLRDISPETLAEHKASGRAIIDPLMSAIAEGVEQGKFKKYPADKIAYFLRAVIIGIAMGFKEGKLHFPDDMSLLEELILPGLMK